MEAPESADKRKKTAKSDDEVNRTQNEKLVNVEARRKWRTVRLGLWFEQPIKTWLGFGEPMIRQEGAHDVTITSKEGGEATAGRSVKAQQGQACRERCGSGLTIPLKRYLEAAAVAIARAI